VLLSKNGNWQEQLLSDGQGNAEDEKQVKDIYLLEKSSYETKMKAADNSRGLT
jgi:hypothetical protein